MAYRIGLLGASRIAPPAVIAPAKASAAFVNQAIAARDPARARDYAAQYGIANVAQDYAALIARDDVDVVYNALPPAGHREWTIRALEAGKHVLCEKPFARNAAEARDMVAAAAKSGRVLMEAYHYRYHTVMRQAEDVAKNWLGAILTARAHFDVPIQRTETELRWRADQGGGALMDLGCYPLHALRTLIGGDVSVESAEADFRDGVDAWTKAKLRFSGGATAEIECSMVSEGFGAALTLEGENGRLDIGNFIAPQMGCRMTSTIGGEAWTYDTAGPTTYEAQLAHLQQALETGAQPLTGGADAIAQMEAIDAIYQAAGRA